MTPARAFIFFMRSLFPLPPPILCLLIGIVMYWFPPIGPHWRFGFLVIFFILLSAVVAMTAVAQFYQQKTTIDPQQLEQTTQLVTSGVFRITRNPMYLSLLFILIAWALWLAHLLAWTGVIVFVWLMNRWQIAREEAFLEQKFGADYCRYREKVRRWL